jgi:hypothetical protein
MIFVWMAAIVGCFNIHWGLGVAVYFSSSWYFIPIIEENITKIMDRFSLVVAEKVKDTDLVDAVEIHNKIENDSELKRLVTALVTSREAYYKARDNYQGPVKLRDLDDDWVSDMEELIEVYSGSLMAVSDEDDINFQEGEKVLKILESKRFAPKSA